MNFEILIRLKMPNQVVTLLNRLVWSRLKHGYSESYRAIVLSLYFLNTLWSILKHGYLEMLLKAILNPTVHPITAPSSATDDFKEPPVFVKELVDMEANDGDRVELVVKVEGQYP